ncbi:MAG: hypothetical protein R2695_07575 [Acidimicrobiales bacterium]
MVDKGRHDVVHRLTEIDPMSSRTWVAISSAVVMTAIARITASRWR